MKINVYQLATEFSMTQIQFFIRNISLACQITSGSKILVQNSQDAISQTRWAKEKSLCHWIWVKGNWYFLVDFVFNVLRGSTVLTACLLSCTTSPLEEGITVKGNNCSLRNDSPLSPLWTISDRVSTHVYPFPPKLRPSVCSSCSDAYHLTLFHSEWSFGHYEWNRVFPVLWFVYRWSTTGFELLVFWYVKVVRVSYQALDLCKILQTEISMKRYYFHLKFIH